MSIGISALGFNVTADQKHILSTPTFHRPIDLLVPPRHFISSISDLNE